MQQKVWGNRPPADNSHALDMVFWTRGGYLLMRETTCDLHAPALNCVQLFVTPWTVACQVSLSMGFPRQEYWSGLPSPSGVLLNTGIESASPALAGGFFSTEPLGKPLDLQYDSEILLLSVYPFPE